MNPRMGMAASAYRRAAASVHPAVAVVKLYDETILAIRQAIRAKESGDHEGAFTRVLRAATILRGLSHSLDFEQGGEVAERLLGVYKRYILLLHLSYGKPDVVVRYRKLLDGLIELRDAWASIAGMPAHDHRPEIDPDTAASLARLVGETRPVVRAASPERPERIRRRAAATTPAATSEDAPPVPRPKLPGSTRTGPRERPIRIERARPPE